ncbi:IS1595 family transposase [Alicyclobacillaceae bacterium I2511]|nr:IS1595 family transposase [Alicyclobacillaceae bacterium I2511]
MNLVDFTNRFSSESACEEHLIALRWPSGFCCPKCGSRNAMRVQAAHRRNAVNRVPLFECKDCHRQTSVTSGTIFHKSQTPLTKWFVAIYLVANDKGGIAATTLERALGVSYPIACLMLRKIRIAMADRNAKYRLEGIVQVDDFYLGGESEGKRGRGTDQAPVVTGVSMKKGKPEYLFMDLVNDLSKHSVLEVLSGRLTKGVILETDGWPTYASCAEDLGVQSHLITRSRDGNKNETFQWLDKAISNFKKFIDGTYHGRQLDDQLYMEEYTYRYNRRNFGHRLV